MRNVDQIQVMLERPAHGQCGGSGQTDEGAEAGAHRFVDQFEAATAGDHHKALTRIDVSDLHRADQLVESVVPADVFAAQQRLTAGIEVQRRVQGAAAAGQLLSLFNTLADAIEMRGRRQCAGLQDLQLRQRLLQRFDATDAATAGAGHLPTMIFQRPEGTTGNLHIGLAGLIEMRQMDIVDLVDAVDDRVAQAEATDEVFEVAGRDHHHRLTQAIEGDRQSNFRGQGGVRERGVLQVFAKRHR